MVRTWVLQENQFCSNRFICTLQQTMKGSKLFVLVVIATLFAVAFSDQSAASRSQGEFD